jgi:hypothetical protein
MSTPPGEQRIRPRGFLPTPRRLVAAGSLTVGATLALGGSANAATFTVTNLSDGTSPDPPGSLREALDAANSNGSGADTITFASGLTGTIHLVTPLFVNYSTSIQGPGPSQVTVSGENAYPPFFNVQGSSPAPDVSISGLTIRNGSFEVGAGIFSIGENLSLDNAVITGNNASTSGSSNALGGGIFAKYGALSITNSTISGNSVKATGSGSARGGGIYAYATSSLTLKNSTVSGNSAQFGGGTFSYYAGPTDIVSSTVSGNQASEAVGGLELIGFTQAHSIIDSTISGNVSSGPTGGVYVYGPVTFTGSTVAANSAALKGGGIYGYPTTANVLRDTIVAGNSAPSGPDLVSNFSSSFSLVQNPSGATITDAAPGSNQIGADPQLGPLANNGGPTQTMALPPTSPAVDKGAAFGLNADQRGVLRPIDFPSIPNSTAAGADGSDIGAFELQPANAITLGKLKRNKKKGTAVQTVNLPLPDAGTLTLSGKGLKTKTQTVADTGIAKLKVIAKGKVRKRLKHKGKAKIRETVTYNPIGQSPNSVAKKIKLLKKRRHR